MRTPFLFALPLLSLCGLLACPTGEEIVECGDPVQDEVLGLEGPARVVVNEAVWSQGGAYDWIELFNAGGEEADLSGWGLVDGDHRGGGPEAYRFPEGTTLGSGRFLVAHRYDYEHRVDAGDQVHVYSFGLKADDSARLLDPDGRVASELRWEGMGSSEAAGRWPDGDEQDFLGCPTPGGINLDPLGDEHCAARPECLEQGMCGSDGTTCWKRAAEPAECEVAEEEEQSVCRLFGHCSLDEDGLCKALSIDDCERMGAGEVQVDCSSQRWSCTLDHGTCRVTYNPPDGGG